MLEKLRLFLTDSKWRFKVLAAKGLLKPLSDKAFISYLYKKTYGKRMNWESPQTFAEKLQWLKLNERNPLHTLLVDKAAVKLYVAQQIGDEYIIPIYGEWTQFEDIDFEALPKQFVLKCNHDSGGYVICRDKSEFDAQKAKKKLVCRLKQNYYTKSREWPYKDIQPRIIAEAYIEDHELHDLRDYKFFTFCGVPKIVHIVSNRQNQDEETYGDFFDMDYNHLDLTMGHNNAPVPPEKPKNFEKMKEFAEKLSEGTKHLRVDFYEADGQLYFGELTFFQDSGFSDIQPPEWDGILGGWISLD